MVASPGFGIKADINNGWTKQATLPKLLPLRSPATKLTPTC
jgi:hypothetical protein